MTRKILAIIAAAICTLAITATAFAAEFINADQARSIACLLYTSDAADE